MQLSSAVVAGVSFAIATQVSVLSVHTCARTTNAQCIFLTLIALGWVGASTWYSIWNISLEVRCDSQFWSGSLISAKSCFSCFFSQEKIKRKGYRLKSIFRLTADF